MPGEFIYKRIISAVITVIAAFMATASTFYVDVTTIRTVLILYLQRAIRIVRNVLLVTAVGVACLGLANMLHPSTTARILGAKVSITMGLSLTNDGAISVPIKLPDQPNRDITIRFHVFHSPLQIHCTVLPGWENQLKTANFNDIKSEQIVSQAQPAAIHHLLFTLGKAVVILAAISLLGFTVRWLYQLIRSRPWDKGRYWSWVSTCTGLIGFFALAILAWTNATMQPVSLSSASISGNVPAAVRQINLLMAAPGASSPLLKEQLKPSLLPDKVVRLQVLSDFHNSSSGYALAHQWESDFGVDFNVILGDEVDSSFPGEPKLAQLEADLTQTNFEMFKRPIVVVKGNHDPDSLMAMLSRLKNVTVLDHNEITWNGLTIYGLGDPLFSPESGLDDLQQACKAASAVPSVEQDLNHLPTPDVVIGHAREMFLGVDTKRPDWNPNRVPECITSSYIPGRVPLILAGHEHRSYAQTIIGTTVINIGTSGGSGLSTNTIPVDQTPFSAEILTFAGTQGNMRLIQRDILTKHHQGRDMSKRPIDDRIPVIEPWYQTDQTVAPQLAAA